MGEMSKGLMEDSCCFGCCACPPFRLVPGPWFLLEIPALSLMGRGLGGDRTMNQAFCASPKVDQSIILPREADWL